jgi:hypothetical protein
MAPFTIFTFQENGCTKVVLKSNIKIYIKTALTFFGAVIPSSANVCSHTTTVLTTPVVF